MSDEQDLNKYQEIAKKRLAEIAYSAKRILGKIAAEEKNPYRDKDKIGRLKSRLCEYRISTKALNLTLKSGVEVLIKDKKQQALIAALSDADAVPDPTPGVKVDPPPGELKIKGHTPK